MIKPLHRWALFSAAAAALLAAGAARGAENKAGARAEGAKKEGPATGTPAAVKAKPAAKKSAKPKTHTVERGPFRVQVKLKALIEAREMTEVALRPRTWRKLEVLEAVEPGARVTRGDILITLDREKIDEEIEKIEKGRELKDLAFKRAGEDLRLLEQSVPLELAAAQRARKLADEDLRLWVDVDQPRTIRNMAMSVKRLTNWLEYEKEELRQLEKMYKADELTEETEEIILKRQRDYVERVAYILQDLQLEQGQLLKVHLPRRLKALKESAKLRAAAWDTARTTLPMNLRKKRLDLAKRTADREKAAEHIAKLKADRTALVVKAPASGIVYYGRCVRGKWTGATSAESALVRGGSLRPHQVLLTLVKSRPIFLRAVVGEKDLRDITVGLSGRAVPAGFPDLKLRATVSQVAATPFAAGKFDAKITVDLDGDTDALMPGMTCTVTFVPYKRRDAVSIPAKLVHTEELNDDEKFVYVHHEGGEPEKRSVALGRKSGKKVEILRGLREGEEVLLSKPKKEAKKRPPAAKAARTEVRAPAARRKIVPRPVKPPTRAEIDRAIGRGVAFLLARQNKDGSWGSHYNTKGLNIYAPAPGAHHAFRTAVTSMCISALIEAGKTGKNGEKVAESLRRGEAWLLKRLPKLRRATPDTLYNIWGHAYAIQALVRLRGRDPKDAARRAGIEKHIRDQIGWLTRYETVDGGWCYYDFRVRTRKPGGSTSSFLTSTVLVALRDAKAIGIEAPEKIIRRAVRAVQRQRKPDHSYLYGENHKYYPMYSINRPGGSLGRSQACNVALRLWGDKRVTDEVLVTWLNRLFARNDWLGMGRKRPVPHESWFAVAGYFYYYGHYYAALCMDQLDAAARKPFQAHMARLLIDLQEKDGSWWDYPLYDYHQPYGTAFALMSLQRCRSE